MDIQQITEQFNEVASHYDQQRRSFIPCFDDYYITSTSFLANCRNNFRTILDLGAGTGLLTKYLIQHFPAASFYLMDISEQMMDIARLRFKNQDNIKYIIADYSKNMPDEKFDLIASALSIHHFNEDEKIKLYTRLYDKLEAGGYLFNLDQFNSCSDEINTMYNNFWYKQIRNSGLSDDECQSWLKRKELDKENSIDETKSMLKSIGFSQVECVYHYMKFGVILAIK
ncbi:MAG: methyltransferase domain-containing protein [Bacteroidota bacterium]|nr:methyltransferase domain-containing protein [Bacteroidota bacterium]